MADAGRAGNARILGIDCVSRSVGGVGWIWRQIYSWDLVFRGSTVGLACEVFRALLEFCEWVAGFGIDLVEREVNGFAGFEVRNAGVYGICSLSASGGLCVGNGSMRTLRCADFRKRV